jgi:hypothetical protein
LPASPIVKQTHQQSQAEYKSCHTINQVRREVNTGKFENKEMDIGRAHVLISQKIPDLPMPIGEGAVSQTIPDAQKKPRKSGKGQQDEV